AELVTGGPTSACSQCIVNELGSTCLTPATTCTGDPACKAIIDCVNACASTDPNCGVTCILPLDTPASHDEYALALGCACPKCPSCAYSQTLTCGEGGAGAGGSGLGGGGAGP